MASKEFENFLEEIKKNLTVEQIMTKKNDFVYYEDSNLNNVQFDILPRKNLKEFWKRGENKFFPITSEDIISLHLDLLSLLDCFKYRDFYFVKHGREIDGIVHYSDLKKPAIRILFYILISNLELKFREYYKNKEKFIRQKLSGKRLQEIENKINKDKRKNQNLSFLDYLNFSDFLNLIANDNDALGSMKLSKEKFKKFFSLNNLRNWIAHPTKEEPISSKNIKVFLIEEKRKIYELSNLLDKLRNKNI